MNPPNNPYMPATTGRFPGTGANPANTPKQEPLTMFAAVSATNEAFGNPKGDANLPNWKRLKRQAEMIAKEVEEELDVAVKHQHLSELRDVGCDVLVYTLGLFHLMGIDVEADMDAVYQSNMSKFCRDNEELAATCDKYQELGVPFKTEGEFPRAFLRCTETVKVGSETFTAGKFLKGINYQPPVFK